MGSRVLETGVLCAVVMATLPARGECVEEQMSDEFRRYCLSASTEPRVYYPLPGVVEDRPARKPRTPGRQGSGGIAVDAFYMQRFFAQKMDSMGIRVKAASLVGRSMRLGVVGAVALDDHILPGDGVTVRDRITDGGSLRLGALVGWGAPWNDTVAGFSAELGVIGGMHKGRSFPCFYGDTCPGMDQDIRLHGERTGFFYFASPYAAWSLVLQLPWKLPVRPTAGITGMTYLGPDGLRITSGFDFGLVVQAW